LRKPDLENLTMFEIDGVTEVVAREALRLAAMKLPVKCRFVQKEDW